MKVHCMRRNEILIQYEYCPGFLHRPMKNCLYTNSRNASVSAKLTRTGVSSALCIPTKLLCLSQVSIDAWPFAHI